MYACAQCLSAILTSKVEGKHNTKLFFGVFLNLILFCFDFQVHNDSEY